jgi:hypothetical protein
MDGKDLQERFCQSATTFRAFLRFRFFEKGKAGSLHAYGNGCAAVLRWTCNGGGLAGAPSGKAPFNEVEDGNSMQVISDELTLTPVEGKSRDDEVTRRHHGYQRIPPVLETAQKPYYYGSKNPHVIAVFTTALFGSAPERFTRALPPTTGKASGHVDVMTWV